MGDTFQIELEFRSVGFRGEGKKLEYPEKTSRSKDENQQQTQPTHDAESGNRTRATLVGGECSHHCAIPAPITFSASMDFATNPLKILSGTDARCSILL